MRKILIPETDSTPAKVERNLQRLFRWLGLTRSGVVGNFTGRYSGTIDSGYPIGEKLYTVVWFCDNGAKRTETYKEMKDRQQAELNALPLGFAFSDAQFEEMKKRLGVTDNSELTSLGNYGGYFRKADKGLILGTFRRHAKERKEAMYLPDGRINTPYLIGAIYYEMRNHEYIFNPDGKPDVLAAVGLEAETLTDNPEIKNAWDKAYSKYYKDAVDNDWI